VIVGRDDAIWFAHHTNGLEEYEWPKGKKREHRTIFLYRFCAEEVSATIIKGTPGRDVRVGDKSSTAFYAVSRLDQRDRIAVDIIEDFQIITKMSD